MVVTLSGYEGLATVVAVQGEGSDKMVRLRLQVCVFTTISKLYSDYGRRDEELIVMNGTPSHRRECLPRPAFPCRRYLQGSQRSSFRPVLLQPVTQSAKINMGLNLPLR